MPHKGNCVARGCLCFISLLCLVLAGCSTASENEITLRNLKFEKPDNCTYTKDDETLTVDIGKGTLVIVTSKWDDADGMSVSDFMSLLNLASKSAFSDRLNATPLAVTIAGFTADGVTFASYSDGEALIVSVLSFFDGEYIYTITHVDGFYEDDLSLNLEVVEDFLTSATYVG